MKYTEAWASVSSQNSILKGAVVSLSLVTVVLALVTIKTSFEESVVIERGCFTTLANTVNSKHTLPEITQFLKMSLSQRFDSDVQPVDHIVAFDELALRNTEQKELESRNIFQRVIINGVEETPEGFKVDTDRIISVGDVRSAFRFTLIAKIESVSRSLSNPYGLILTNTRIQVPKEKK